MQKPLNLHLNTKDKQDNSEWYYTMKNKFYWHSYIKSPLQARNGYIAHGKGVYKIVDYKLGRHFSYVNIARVKASGELCAPIYLAIVGESWADTAAKLGMKIHNYVNEEHNIWADLSGPII